MALISGTFVWSYEVGAKLSATIYCMIFDVDDDGDHMDNYPKALIAKLPILLLVLICAIFIPNNEDIQKKADELREDYQKQKLASQRDSLEGDPDRDAMLTPMMDDMNEGGEASNHQRRSEKVGKRKFD